MISNAEDNQDGRLSFTYRTFPRHEDAFAEYSSTEEDL